MSKNVITPAEQVSVMADILRLPDRTVAEILRDIYEDNQIGRRRVFLIVGNKLKQWSRDCGAGILDADLDRVLLTELARTLPDTEDAVVFEMCRIAPKLSYPTIISVDADYTSGRFFSVILDIPTLPTKH